MISGYVVTINCCNTLSIFTSDIIDSGVILNLTPRFYSNSVTSSPSHVVLGLLGIDDRRSPYAHIALYTHLRVYILPVLHFTYVSNSSN